jgi:glycosyltransferase involved in cell wall biosynthesis
MSAEPWYAVTTDGVDAQRWLMVDGAADFGGHEVMLLRLIEELRAQGRVTPIVLSRAGSRLAAATRAISAPYELVATPEDATGLRRRWESVKRAGRDAWTFIRNVREVKPHLCFVAEGCLMAQPVFAFAARLLGVRIVLYVALLDDSRSMGFGLGALRDTLVRWFYANLPHAWIAITREQAVRFREWTRLHRPVLVLPNTVARSIEQAAQESASTSVASTSAKLRVVVLGRLEAHQKGLDELIEFLTANPALGQSLTLNFVGSGPFEGELRRALEQAPWLTSWVQLRPWSDAQAVLREHDVLLMTSRYEGVPLVMLEAMAMGVPVVASDLPGIRAFIAPDCLFAVSDLARAFAIIERLCDQWVRQDIGERNRTIFAERASNTAFATAVSGLTTQLARIEQLPPLPRSA